jgi:hypothetical protein
MPEGAFKSAFRLFLFLNNNTTYSILSGLLILSPILTFEVSARWSSDFQNCGNAPADGREGPRQPVNLSTCQPVNLRSISPDGALIFKIAVTRLQKDGKAPVNLLTYLLVNLLTFEV